MVAIYVNLYEINTNKLIATFPSHKHPSKELIIDEIWHKAIDIKKIGFNKCKEDYRFELIFR